MQYLANNFILSEYKKSLIITLFATLFSCAKNTSKIEYNQVQKCEIGENCILKGSLDLYNNVNHGAVGVLDLQGDCIALALPPSIYEQKKWDTEKMVIIKGKVYSQPVGGIVSYQLIDRQVAGGVCEKGKIIYVTEIKKS